MPSATGLKFSKLIKNSFALLAASPLQTVLIAGFALIPVWVFMRTGKRLTQRCDCNALGNGKNGFYQQLASAGSHWVFMLSTFLISTANTLFFILASVLLLLLVLFGVSFILLVWMANEFFISFENLSL